jgi:hypothetical protein
VAVAVFSPAAIVLAGGLTVGGRRERPHPADVGEPVVLDMPVRDRQGSPRGADGSDPAEAFSARASANRARSSPISASTCAPVESANPGKLMMIA